MNSLLKEMNEQLPQGYEIVEENGRLYVSYDDAGTKHRVTNNKGKQKFFYHPAMAAMCAKYHAERRQKQEAQ